MMALMPVWSIAVPFCLGLFITCLLFNSVAFVPAAIVMLTLVSIPVVSIMLAALCEDETVTVSREGLAFPIMFLPQLQFKRERLWSDLNTAQLTEINDTDRILQLHFGSGGHALLNMKNMSKSDREQLMLSMEVYAKNCKRSPELIEYQNRVQNENRGVDHLSYTQMWEEELSRRFSATSFVPLEPEQILQNGKFTIVRQLAFGGLSAIYLAQQEQKELVIVKEAVVPASAEEHSRQKATDLFDREARLLTKLDHPNIAKVYDHFMDGGRNYLVLEYVRGQDLRQLVKQTGAQPENTVLSWALQIASILEYLHNQTPTIIHRDLTPDNLVQRDSETVVLIDFGAANEFVGTATGTLVGKQAYISPEQLRGKATGSSDIYALGGTLYFLLTGKDPEALTTSRPKDLVPSISQDLDDLIANCTEMEESDRPANSSLLVQRLKEIIASQPGTADSITLSAGHGGKA